MLNEATIQSVSVLTVAFLFLFSVSSDISPKKAPGLMIKNFSYLYNVTNLNFPSSFSLNIKSYEFISIC